MKPRIFIGSSSEGGSVSGTFFDSPYDLAFDSSGNLWVTDSNNHRVLKFSTLTNNAAADFALGQNDVNADSLTSNDQDRNDESGNPPCC